MPLIIEVEASHQLPPNIFDIEKGENFDRKILEVTDEGVKYTWQSTPQRLLSESNLWEDYLYFEDDNVITVETAQGSFEIDKNTCAMSFYNGGTISGNPTIPSDTYLVKQSADGVTFNNVNQVNNAVCQTNVIMSGNDIEVQTIKKSAMGEVKIRYIKIVGDQLKSQMEVTNTSGLNNRFFGFTQLLEVPQMINFGDKLINLAAQKDKVYDRDFIKANRDKIVKLTDKINYNFDKGFKNLKDITVRWNGVQAVLEFDYSHNAQILPHGSTFIIDPTFEFTEAIFTRIDSGFTGPDNLCATSGFNDVAGSAIVFIPDNNTNAACARVGWDWDITSLPTNADINSATLRYSVPGQIGNMTCDMYHAEFRPSVIGPSDPTAAWNDAANGTLYIDDWVGCAQIPAANYTELLPQSMLDNIRSEGLAQDWFGFWTKYSVDPNRNASVYIVNFMSNSSFTSHLRINYTLGFIPDRVDDLLISNIQAVTLDLDWTEPFLNGTLSGYQINFTSPQGDPNTIIINDTGTSDTSFAVSGLTQLTPYSFRIGVWTNHTSNMTGNVANTTTITLGNFTVGFFDINATQTDARLFKYERIDISDTIVDLEVTYPSAFNTSCNFYYKFAQKNDTYYNLAHVSLPATSEDMATFRFINVTNEIINVNCMDETSGVSSPFLITQAAFPLLQQFINFSDGTYGTAGNFGAIDLITLGVIIVMMVGFNRVNESVGAIFAVIILGFFSFFDIVEWFSFMFGTFAVVIMLVIASTRKM